MASKRPPPRTTIARNLRALLKVHGMTSPEVAHKAGVDAKTLNNLLHGRFDPRPEKCEQVAAVFGLTGWQLMIPELSSDLFQNGRLAKLIEDYASADESGRDNILRVAEMAARYSTPRKD